MCNDATINLTECQTIKVRYELGGFKKEDILLSGKNLEIEGPAYTYPTNSSMFNMLKVKNIKPEPEVVNFKLTDVQCKIIFHEIYELESDENKISYVTPILHIK